MCVCVTASYLPTREYGAVAYTLRLITLADEYDFCDYKWRRCIGEENLCACIEF